jgi:GNAT superfamily N-acetyltransferase/RimJ/RimL family protein N-acetyltransferase
MQIEGFDPGAEPGKVRAFYEMYAAGLPIDDPDGPPFSPPLYMSWIRDGWEGERRQTALAVDDDGTPMGGCLVELAEGHNRHISPLTLVVPPDRRRHGVGRELLRYAIRRAAAEGRTLLTAEARLDTPGAAFAAAVGARAGLIAVRRVLDLTAIPDGHLARLRAKAEAASHGYSLVRWSGPTPEEYLLAVATVPVAMDDAPHNPGRKGREPDPDRIRRAERRAVETGTRRYSVAARCDQTGEFAGLTQIAVDKDDPEWAYQLITAVVRAHRGHRLGLLAKVSMLEMLTEAEPTVRRIMTSNADANKHMISINAELGFTVLDRWQTWDLDVTAVPA